MVTVVPVPALVAENEVTTGGTRVKVKPASDAVPPGVLTLTLREAPGPTIAAIDVDEITVNDVAGMPPKLTAVAPVKLVPAMATRLPFVALVGVNEVIVGAGMNVKPARVPVPPGVVTLTEPDAPAATTAVMLLAETTLKEVAAVPPKLTAVAPVKLLPVIVTTAPAAAEPGVNDDITGAGMKVNPAREAEPPGVVTLTLPDAPLASTALMDVAEFTTNEAADVPPKLTEVAPVNFVPVMVTIAPAPAESGVNEVILGSVF